MSIMGTELKCKKCRSVLVNTNKVDVLNYHWKQLETLTNAIEYSCQNDISDNWYLNDVNVPDWILKSVNEADWQKGKLKCPHCGAGIGSFDFISGMKCSCQEYILPPIHVVKSKVDVSIKITSHVI